MSYNILKSKVNFVGDDTPEIEGIVDTSTDQTINGQKTFTDLSASNISIGERISHTGDSDTRIQFGTDNIAFMADGGTQILTVYGNLNPDRVQVNNGNLIVANDNLGVGVLTPSFKLQVDGNISGSGTFHNVGNATFGGNLSVTGTISGNGSGLTNLPIASNMLAESIIGQVSGSQISASNGLTTSGNNLVVQVSGTASGLVSETNGIKIDLTGLGTTSYSDADFILISSSAGNRKMQLSTLESGFDSLAASQVTSGRFDTARMPTTINGINFLTSSVISASTFHGNGENLTGVTATPTPAGSDTEIQFNDGGSLAGDPQLLFLKTTNTLATTALSASGDLSGSTLHLLDSINLGGTTFINSLKHVFSSNISGSGTIHVVGSASFGNDLSITGAYFGDGRQLTGLPIANAASNAVVTVNNATTKTVDASSNFVYDGSDVIVTSGDVKATNLSASSDLKAGGHITGSGDIRLLNGDLYLGGGSRIFFDGDDGGSAIDVFMTERAGGNGIIIDGKNRIRFKADQYVIYEAPDSSEPVLINFNSTPYQLRLQMALSSSQYISASSYAIAGGTVITEEGDFQGNNAFFNEITGSSLFIESDSADTAPQIHIHEDDTEYGRLSFTNNADTNGSIGAFSHEWTIAASSSAQGLHQSASFNIFYGDGQNDGSGADILTINGSGSAQLQGTLGLNCRNSDGSVRTDPPFVQNHAHIYSKLDSGTAEMFVKDSDGNITKISPHTSEGEWEYFSRNTRTGKVVRVNMERMIRKLEEITGESFMEEWYEDPTDLTP